jgi:hypothetical protein
MKIKTDLKIKARELRKQGTSVVKIAKELSVSKSSVSEWTRDVILTEEQKELLATRSISDAQALAHKIYFRNKRILPQNKGRERVKEGDPLFIAGCMLYWGEGSKDINSAAMANSDLNLLLVFKKFLLTCFDIKVKDLVLVINCYDDVHSVDAIEKYWLNNLGLSRKNIRKTMVNYLPKSSKLTKAKKLPYGTATLKVHRTDVVQEIYGAIQEFAGFTNLKWLDH